MRLDRYGVLPILAACGLLIMLGLLSLNWLVNNAWLVPTGQAASEELRRAVGEGRADAAALLSASDYGLIVLFLIGVWIIGFGLSLPLIYFVNRRIRTARATRHATTAVLLRQTAWAGTWMAICVYLQMNRVFNIPIALMILTTFVLFETLLILRRKSAETVLAELHPADEQ